MITKKMKTLTLNDLGKRILVEDCQKIKMKEFFDTIKKKAKEDLFKSELYISNLKIDFATSKTSFGGTRYWFSCPICKGRTGTLFVHPFTINVGCRKCLNLEYKKRVFKGMVENE
mgnify:CR=1 FL=1